MNLLLFTEQELSGELLVLGPGRRLQHLNRVLHSAPGDSIRVGEIGGKRGTAVVESIDAEQARLRVAALSTPSPAGLDLTVVLALPRPKMLRRILRGCAELGIRDLHLINSARVEKSFWQSPLLADAALREYLLSGLEQAGATQLPSVTLQRRFRPFAEDLLPGLCDGRAALLAEPGAPEPFPSTPGTPGLLAIGPEGGFVPFEVELLQRAGCAPVSLGARVLRVETALHCALGRYLVTPAS